MSYFVAFTTKSKSFKSYAGYNAFKKVICSPGFILTNYCFNLFCQVYKSSLFFRRRLVSNCCFIAMMDSWRNSITLVWHDTRHTTMIDIDMKYHREKIGLYFVSACLREFSTAKNFRRCQFSLLPCTLVWIRNLPVLKTNRIIPSLCNSNFSARSACLAAISFPNVLLDANTVQYKYNLHTQHTH